MIDHNYYEINTIEEAGPFKYVLSIGPIDWFQYTLSKKQIIDNILEEEYINKGLAVNEIIDIEQFVIDYTERIEETPFVRYVSIPNQYSNQMDLVAISRISNNGTGFVFSNDVDFLNYIKKIKY